MHSKSFDILLQVPFDHDVSAGVPIWASAWSSSKSLQDEGFGSLSEQWRASYYLFNACNHYFRCPEVRNGRLMGSGYKSFAFAGPAQLGPKFPLVFDATEMMELLKEPTYDLSSPLYSKCSGFAREAFNFWAASTASSQAYLESCARTLLLDIDPTRDSSKWKVGRLGELGSKASAIISQLTTEMLAMTASFASDATMRTDNLTEDRSLTYAYQKAIAIAFGSYLNGTRVALGPNGQLCNVPESTEVGDIVVILAGSRMPNLLRPVETESGLAFRLIGEGYVHGIMDGEAIAEAPKWVSTGHPDVYDLEWEKIALL